MLKGDRCKTQKCAMVKRNYAPGFHGPSQGGRRRLTNYGSQLTEKQKAKKQYGLMEKQFLLTFEKAKRKTGNTGEIFLQMLEMRLDNVVFRAGLTSSRAQARQHVTHGLFTVNGTRVDIPSFVLKTGDVVKVKANKKDLKAFKDLTDKIKSRETVGWLDVDAKEFSAKILHKPDMAIIKPNFNIQMIIEFYSR